MTQHLEHVLRERDNAIITAFGPVGFTVAAQVDSDRLPPTLGYRGSRSAPRAAGLAAAVQEYRGGRMWIAEAVGDDTNAVDAGRAEEFG